MVSQKKKLAIEKATDKIAKKLSKNKKASVSIKTKFMFGIMRMMQNGGMGSGEKEKEYWQEKGWLSKKRPWKK